jgi:hypothetical protein
MKLKLIEVIAVGEAPKNDYNKDSKEVEFVVSYYENIRIKISDGTYVKEKRLESAKTKLSGVTKGLFLVEFREGTSKNGNTWRKIDRIFKTNVEALLNEINSDKK